MNHATYLLNPGDMFQVEPESVMFATGKIKRRKYTGKLNPAPWKVYDRHAKAAVAALAEEEATSKSAAAAPEADEGPLEPDEDAAENEGTEAAAVDDDDATPEEWKRRLGVLARAVRKNLKDEDDEFGAKRKRRMRLFVKRARAIQAKLSRKDGTDGVTPDLMDLVREGWEMTSTGDKPDDEASDSGAVTSDEMADAIDAAKAEEPSEPKPEGSRPRSDSSDRNAGWQMSEGEEELLSHTMAEFDDNPWDDRKPYKTPWEPRPFMSPFAFIPRYLEVNQNICAAVYLRHPVARHGMAEVPSPFPPGVQELAFNWYLRRR